MLCGIDLLSLFDWAVIEPEDDVSVIVEFWARHRDWFVGIMREDGKRAGSIEGQTPDRRRVNVVLVKDALDGRADTTPDVVG